MPKFDRLNNGASVPPETEITMNPEEIIDTLRLQTIDAKTFQPIERVECVLRADGTVICKSLPSDDAEQQKENDRLAQSIMTDGVAGEVTVDDGAAFMEYLREHHSRTPQLMVAEEKQSTPDNSTEQSNDQR